MLPTDKPSFQEHIRFLQRPDTWATQVEVIAVATMFSVAVFYCRKQDSLYHWEVINPLTCPSVSDVQGVMAFLELQYHTTLSYTGMDLTMTVWYYKALECVVIQPLY